MKLPSEQTEPESGFLELASAPNALTAVVLADDPAEPNKAAGEPMAARVSAHPFLAGMDRHQLALLTDCALTKHFDKGEIILKQGEFANRFYLIESGKVVLEAAAAESEALIVGAIGAGDLLGWSWMFPPYIWQFSARAAEPTAAIFFYGTILREYCERDPAFGFELHKRMSAVIVNRLQATRNKMLAMQMHGEKLEPAIGLPPFMEQELDTDAIEPERPPTDARSMAA